MKKLALLAMPLLLAGCSALGAVDSTTWTLGGSWMPPGVFFAVTVHHVAATQPAPVVVIPLVKPGVP